MSFWIGGKSPQTLKRKGIAAEEADSDTITFFCIFFVIFLISDRCLHALYEKHWRFKETPSVTDNYKINALAEYVLVLLLFHIVIKKVIKKKTYTSMLCCCVAFVQINLSLSCIFSTCGCLTPETSLRQSYLHQLANTPLVTYMHVLKNVNPTNMDLIRDCGSGLHWCGVCADQSLKSPEPGSEHTLLP